MFKLGNSYVSAQQLLKLGAHIHQNEKEYFFYPNSLIYETDLLNLHNKFISLRPENWFSYFCDKFENIQSLDELNWLFEAAKHLKFRGKAELKYPIDQVIRLMNEFDLSREEYHFIISYWLKKISTDTYKLNKIYTEQQFIDRIVSSLQLDNVMEIEGTEFTDSSLFQKLDGNDEEEDKNRLISKRIIFKVFKSNVKFFKALSSVLFSSKSFIYSSAELARRISLERRRTSIASILDAKPGPGIKPVSGVKKVAKIIKKALIGPGSILTIWDATESTLILLNPESTSKDTRDAYATFVFIGGELITTGILIANAAGPAVTFLVTLGWLVASFSYSGVSLVYEYKDENLSSAELFTTFFRGFIHIGLDPEIQEYLNHRKFLSSLAQKNYSYLVKEKSICFVANGIGKSNDNFQTFEDYIRVLDYKVYNQLQINGCFEVPISRKCDLNQFKDCQIGYQSDQVSSVIIPSDLKIAYGKNEMKKLSRLRPELPNEAAEFLCSPNFKEGIEPDSTALYFESKWDCDNGLIVTLKPYNFNEDCTGLYELSLAESGSIDFGEHQVNFKSEFFLLNNSTIQIKIPGNDSPESKFILPPNGCSCKLSGDPMYEKISSTLSTISAEQVKKQYSVIVDANHIITQETKTAKQLAKGKFSHIPFFIGHEGQDIIDCKNTTIKVVNGLGGSADAYDEFTDCPHVILDSYTVIKNTQSLKHESQFIWNRYKSNIIVFNDKRQNILFFLDLTIKGFLESYDFEYQDENKTLYFRGTLTHRLFLTIHNFNPLNLNILFIDKDKISMLPQFLQSEGENTNQYYLSIVYTVQLEDTVENALEDSKLKHKILLIQFPSINLIGKYFHKNRSDRPSFILGGPKVNIFILDNIENLKYVSGHDEVDIYKIDKELFDSIKRYMPATKKLNINNYSFLGKVDKLFFPFLQRDLHFIREGNDLKFSFSIFNKVIFKVEKYFLSAIYQHLVFIDSEQNSCIPFINPNNTLSKILYFESVDDPDDQTLFAHLENKEGDFSLAIESTEFSSQPKVYRNIEHIFVVDESKVIKIPIEQFKPVIKINIYKTSKATYVHAFNTDADLLEVETKSTQYILDLYQENINASTTVHSYTNENFENENTKIFSILPDINMHEKRNRYIELEELPFDIKVEYKFDNLFFTFYDKNYYNLNLLLAKWDNSNPYITAILVSKNKFVCKLNFESMDIQHLQEWEQAFRKEIILSKFEELLEKNSFKERMKALIEILFLYPKNIRSKDQNFYHFFQFDSEEAMLAFQYNIEHIQFNPTLTKVFAQSFLLYYLKVIIRYPEMKENYEAIITDELHTLFFENFEEKLKTKFETYIIDLMEHIVDDALLKNVFFNLLVEGNANKLIKHERNLFYFTFFNYTFRQEDFTHSMKIETVPHTLLSQEKWFFIDLSEVPEDIMFRTDSDDLLVILSNNQNKKIAIRIKNWKRQGSCLDGIIVKEELLISNVCKKPSTPDDLNEPIKTIRVALLHQWINSSLNSYSAISKQEGIFILADQIYFRTCYLTTLNFYKLLGFFSRAEMRLQYNVHLEKIHEMHSFNFDEIQKIEISKVIVLVYVKILSQKPELVEFFKEYISIENYQLLFNNFNQSILADDFTAAVDLKEKIFDLKILTDIHIAITNSQENRVQKYTFAIRRDSPRNFFELTHDYIIFHNQKSEEYKLGYISFDVPPFNIKIDRDQNDLLFILSDVYHKKGIIRVKNWHIPKHRLEGIIIADKILPRFLDFGFIEESSLVESKSQIRSKTDLENFDLKIKKILIELFFLDKLNLVSEELIEAAVCFIIKEVKKTPKADYYISLLTTNNLNFFNLQEFIDLFKHSLNYKISEKNYTVLEKKQIAKVIVTLGIKLMLEYSIFKEILANFFSNQRFESILINFQPLLKASLYVPITQLNAAISSTVNIEHLVSIIDHYFQTDVTQSYYHQIRKKRSEPMLPNTQHNNLNLYYSILISNQTSDHIINFGIHERENLTKKYAINLTNNINLPRIVKAKINQSNKTLLLNFEFNQGKKLSLAFHNYINIKNRIHGIIINNEFVFDELEFLDLEESNSLEKILNAAIIKSWAQVERSSLVSDTTQLEQFKAFLILKTLNVPLVKSNHLSKAFSFKNPRDLKKFCQFYLNPYEQHKIRNLATNIYRDSKIKFFTLIYLYVLEMTQSNIKDEKIQSFFPYLTTATLVNYMNDLAKEAPHLLKNETTLRTLISESATEETTSNNDFQSSVVRDLYVPGDERHAIFSYCSFREKEILNLAFLDYNLITVNIYGNKLSLSVLKSHQTRYGISKRTAKLIQVINFPNPCCRLYGLKDSKQGWEILIPYVNLAQLKDNLQNLLNEKLSSVRLNPPAIDFSNSEESMQADQGFLDLTTKHFHLKDEIKDTNPTSSLIPTTKPNFIKTIRKGTNDSKSENIDSKITTYSENWQGWVFGLGGLGISACLGYGAWILRRHSQLHSRRHPKSEINPALSFPLLSTIPKAQSAKIKSTNSSFLSEKKLTTSPFENRFKHSNHPIDNKKNSLTPTRISALAEDYMEKYELATFKKRENKAKQANHKKKQVAVKQPTQKQTTAPKHKNKQASQTPYRNSLSHQQMYNAAKSKIKHAPTPTWDSKPLPIAVNPHIQSSDFINQKKQTQCFFVENQLPINVVAFNKQPRLLANYQNRSYSKKSFSSPNSLHHVSEKPDVCSTLMLLRLATQPSNRQPRFFSSATRKPSDKMFKKMERQIDKLKSDFLIK